MQTRDERLPEMQKKRAEWRREWDDADQGKWVKCRQSWFEQRAKGPHVIGGSIEKGRAESKGPL